MPPRPYRRPLNSALSAEERGVIEWARLGAGLHAATTLTDVRLCDALRWVETGQANPGGPHGIFAARIKELEATNGTGRLPQSFDVQFSKSWRGYGQRPMTNGHSNGAQQIVRWDD